MKAIGRSPSKFNLPVDLTERLVKAVPSGQRSRFVAKAIEDALQAAVKERLLERLDTMPANSIKGEDSLEILRGLRQERATQLAERHNPLSQ